MTRELSVHPLKLEYMLRHNWITEGDIVDCNERIVRLQPELLQKLVLIGVPNNPESMSQVVEIYDTKQSITYSHTARMIYVCGENLQDFLKKI